MSNHNEQDIIKALDLNEDNFQKISEMLQQLQGIKVSEVMTRIRELNIEDASSYISIFSFLLLRNSSHGMLNNFTTKHASNANVLSKETICDSISTLIAFSQETDQDIEGDKVNKFIILMIPLLILSADPKVPFSFCMETMINLITLLDIPAEDILTGVASMGFMFDPNAPEEIPQSDETTEGESNLQ